MATTIANGAIANVTIPVGQALKLTGSGTVQIGAGSDEVGQIYSVNGPQRLGPWTDQTLAYLTCLSGLSYELIDPNAALPAADLTAADVARVRAGALPVSGTPGGTSIFTARSGAFKGSTTWHQSVLLPDGVDAVRVALLSDVADVSSYAGVKVTVQSTTAASMTNPAGGVPLQPVLWGGAANPTFVAGGIENPALIWSDWTPVVNRGGGLNYLLVRKWYPAGVANGGGYYDVSRQSGRSAKLAALGIASAYKYAATDQVANSSATLSDTTVALPILVQAAYRRRVPTVWQFGDSTRQGWYGDGIVPAVERWGYQRTLAGNPVSVSALGFTDQTSNQYLARLKRLVASGVRCDVLVWQIASPNDVGPGITPGKQIANAVEALEIAVGMGASFVADGPFPLTAGTPNANQTAMVNGAKDWAIAMRSAMPGAFEYADYSALHDPATFGKWKTQYNHAGDGLHQNEAATNEVILPALTAALSGLPALA